MRIAYLSIRDSNDRRSWSGTLYSMGRALERHCGDVVRIGPLEPFSMRTGKLVSNVLRRVARRTYLYTHTARMSKKIGELASNQLARLDPDVIFAPAGSIVIAHLCTSLPIVYLSDTTFRLMLGYNWEFTGLPSSQIRMAEEIERRAISRATQLVFPSSWAAASAESDYGAHSAKINILPFGANLNPAPPSTDALRESRRDHCRLLFVGVNWRYKGGDIAFETLLELEREGIHAELTIVGCIPPEHVRHPNIRVFPFLDKNNKDERWQLERLYKEADFFVLPTRTECFSIALCEANAFGIPVLSTHTGGLTDLVRHDINGFLFPVDASGKEYAARIKEVFSDAERYHRLRISSRDQFETRLNWDAWGRGMNSVFHRAVNLQHRHS